MAFCGVTDTFPLSAAVCCVKFYIAWEDIDDFNFNVFFKFFLPVSREFVRQLMRRSRSSCWWISMLWWGAMNVHISLNSTEHSSKRSVSLTGD